MHSAEFVDELEPSEEPAYSLSSIQFLEGLEPVRRRPGMYVGDLETGQPHLLWEILGNAIDQHLVRRVTRVRVDIDEAQNRFEVEDDGPGMPTEPARQGRPAVEVIFTTLHAGATWDGHFPHVHVAPYSYGLGASLVGALSSRIEVDVRRRGKHWRLAMEHGRLVEPLHVVGASAQTGTRVRWTPDREIFGDRRPALGGVRARLEELAYLNPLLTLQYGGRTLPGRGGLATWVRSLARHAEPTSWEGDTVLEALRHFDEVSVDIAFGWSGRSAPRVVSFVNQSPLTEGTHLTGLWGGLRDAARQQGIDVGVGAIREVLGPGLYAVMNVSLANPEFAGSARDRLKSPVALRAVQRTVSETLAAAFRYGSRLRESFIGRFPQRP
jgi:DNA gyrase subunit B